MAEQWPGEIDDAVIRWRSGDEEAAREVWMLCGPRLIRLARFLPVERPSPTMPFRKPSSGRGAALDAMIPGGPSDRG